MPGVSKSKAVTKFREELDLLKKYQRETENSLLSLFDALKEHGVDMTDSLVDEDGYPRADLDLYQIRTLRGKIRCMQNDLKENFLEIEKKLHLFHSIHKDAQYPPTNVERPCLEDDAKKVFATIGSVSMDSPAYEAGLKLGDHILQFGTVTISNYTGLTDIANVTTSSINKFIRIMLIRENKIRTTLLRPRQWSGPGVIGCVFYPN